MPRTSTARKSTATAPMVIARATVPYTVERTTIRTGAPTGVPAGVNNCRSTGKRPALCACTCTSTCTFCPGRRVRTSEVAERMWLRSSASS